MVLSNGAAPASPDADEPTTQADLPRQERRSVNLKPDENDEPIASATAWENRYAQVLVFVDCTIIYAAMLGALALRFGRNTQVHAGHNESLNYSLVTSTLGFLWLLMLGGHRAYEPRFLGSGVEEYRRVFLSCFRIGAIVAITSYALKLEIARGFIGVALPVGTVLLLVSRYTIRKYVHRARDHGRFSHRLVVAGDRPQVIELVRRIRREAAAGYHIVGVALPDRGRMTVDGEDVPVLGQLDNLPRVLTDARADSVAVTASASMTGDALRKLGWQLEGTGVDLVVAPAVADVAGPRQQRLHGKTRRSRRRRRTRSLRHRTRSGRCHESHHGHATGRRHPGRYRYPGGQRRYVRMGLCPKPRWGLEAPDPRSYASFNTPLTKPIAPPVTARNTAPINPNTLRITPGCSATILD